MLQEHRREFSPDFGFGNFLDEPALFQRLRIEEFEPGDAYLQSGPREFLLMYQVQLILANVFRPQTVWRFVEVPGEVRHGLDVRADRQRGIVPQPKIFNHSLT
jgi:hypothetical protein